MGTNKRENIFSAIIKSIRKKVNMSMSLQIAVSHLKMAILGGLVLFLLFAVYYMLAARLPYSNKAETILAKIENGTMTYKQAEEELLEDNVYYRVTDGNGNVYFSNIPYTGKRVFSFIDGFRVAKKQGSYNLMYEQTMQMEQEGVVRKVLFAYTMTTDFFRMLLLLGALAVTYVIIALFVMRKNRADGEKMLAPIDEMTEMMSKMTINNIASERLKVYEMNTDLQKLAEVFNAMMDRLEESYESQKIFVSNASHELRTPIAVIQGYAGMLERWGSSDEEILKESIDAIMHESKDMQELVEKLLFLSRHDKKTLKLEKDIFNVKPVVEELMKETEMVVEGRSFEIQALEDVSIMGDKQSIKQLLRIFIDNAVKYTEEGDTIKVACRNSRGNLVLTIEDTGIGMSKEDMGKIFERFFRSDEVRGKNISGHGLGLSIAKLIVASHKGNIHVSSKPGIGTTFIIVIPNGINK